MSREPEPPWQEEPYWRDNGVMDAITYDGVDPQAVWRTHMREVTMARQAAERRLALRTSSLPLDRSARARAARERAEEFRAEMERINADHLRWQREHSETAEDPPTLRRKTV